MKKLLLCLLALMSLPIRAQSPIFFQTSFSGLTAAAPTFSPTSPYTGGATTVTITDSTPGATILYCVDTTNACTPATTYTAGLSFSSTEYIRASATASGYNPGPVASWSGTYVNLPVVLQSNTSAADCTGGTCTVTLPSHAAGGMTCVLATYNNSTAPPATPISNTAGFTWTATSAHAYAAWYQQIWCAPTTAYGSTDTFTVTFPAGTYHGGIGVVDTSVVTAQDASQGAAATSYSTPDTGSFTVTGANDMVLAIVKASTTATVGTGFTCLSCSGTGIWVSGLSNLIEYEQITGTPADATASPASNPWSILGVALK